MRYVDELSEALRKQLALAYRAKDLLAYALRQKLREGYTIKDFRADLLAAAVVAIVALPLSMALAIAVDVPPQHGLYTAIIAGVITALLGGARYQVTGPTATYVVILVPVVHTYGLSGLLLTGIMAGAILLAMGLTRMGRLMQFVPHPVTTGLTAGIALLIALLQVKDALGVRLPRTEGTIAYLEALWAARGAINAWDLGVTVATIALLLILPRVLKRIPAPLVVLALVSVAVLVLERLLPGFDATTLGARFSATVGGEVVRGIPPLPPLPIVPWSMESSGAAIGLLELRELLPPAFAIAVLGAIETLMSATVGDAMSGTQHDPNAELISLGVANIVCPFFGGIPASGALARTATNIRAGARSPFAAALHGVLILACTILLAPLVAYLPMAALAGLLLVVARNMAEARHFLRLVRIAPRSDVMVMVGCFALTVLFDMAVAVGFGIVLAALLFMKRMAVMTKINLQHVEFAKFEVPDGIRVYEIAGPLFFGAAKSAMEALHVVGGRDHTVILAMQHVPVIDATGLVALESVLDRLQRSKIKVIFAGLQPEVLEVFARAGIKRTPGLLAYAPDVETAVSMAIVHGAQVGSLPPAAAPPRPAAVA